MKKLPCPFVWAIMEKMKSDKKFLHYFIKWDDGYEKSKSDI